MQRFGRVLKLRPGMAERYRQAHAQIWPDVADAIRASGIRNYTIYRYQDWVFSYFELPDHTDLATVSRNVLSSDACQRWEKLMQEMQEPLPESGTGTWWVPLDELWHFEGK